MCFTNTNRKLETIHLAANNCCTEPLNAIAIKQPYGPCDEPEWSACDRLGGFRKQTRKIWKRQHSYGQPIPKAIVHFNMASQEIRYRQRLALE